MLGYEDTEGLAFTDVSMAREFNELKTRFVVSGNIVNRKDDDRTIPEVRVRLLDKEGEEVWSRVYEVNKTVAGNDIYPFRITNAETSFGERVAQIELDLGNGYELMVR